MSTMGAVGIGKVGDWAGTLVSHDGHPSHLGRALLNLAVDLEGDLEALWAQISAPPFGWESAFEEVRDELGYLEDYCTGTGPSLIDQSSDLIRGRSADGDLLIGMGPEYWYLIDIAQRTLSIYAPPSLFDEHGELRTTEAQGTLLDRIRFEEDGAAVFEVRGETEEDDDWRQRRRDYGSDDIPTTAAAVKARLEEQLPIVGPHFALCLLEAPSLSEGGLVAPVQAQISCASRLEEHLEDIVDHGHLTLFPTRLLRDERRCLHFIEGALAELRRVVVDGQAPSCPVTPFMFLENLFPIALLDLDLSDEEIATRRDTVIRESFQAPTET